MMTRFFATVGASLLLACLCHANPVWLSSLETKEMLSGWRTVQKDKAVAGKPMTIAGQRFDKGIGTHAESKMRIRLDGKGKAFTAKVGVDDGGGPNGTVEFLVEGDGKTLWRSGVLAAGKSAVPTEVPLTGVQILTLRVTAAGDGTRNDHADWAEARLEMVDDSTRPTVIEPFETFAIKTKTFSLEFRIADDGRLYQRPLGAPALDLKRDGEAFPQWGDGYTWEPALQVAHADGNTSTRLEYVKSERRTEAEGRELVRIDLRDPAYAFEVALFFRTHANLDVVEQWAEIVHREPKEVILQRMYSASLLVNPTNLHLTHFHGDWADEMNPSTELITPGTKVLDSKIGMRAHRFQNPSFLLALGEESTETTGRVLGGTLAWAGNFRFAFDHFRKGVRVLAGINPFASQYHLKPGEKFITPVIIWAWSEHGTGLMSRNLHTWARDFGVREGHKTRQVLLNNWEATYFDFDFARIAGLFEPAAKMGVELFLLDDGWFGNKHPRVNDKAGLGDWEPNRKRFPNGLEPLAKVALDQKIRFGIWIEPEMVNPRSELFEKHPDWAIQQPKRELELQRNQLTLDLTRPEVQEFEWNVIKSVCDVPGVSYVKWDCNRYLTQPGSSWLAPDRQSHLWIDYVRALYQLMEKTMKTYPDTELMLCSGGGGRVDYGSLQYFHEFWPSDNTDPARRVTMQWDYSYFFPALSISSHVTHWGKRPMHFACTVAMSARYGMDLDLAKLSEEEKTLCAGAIAAYKRIRDVVHQGDLYRLERPHNAARGAINYVSRDKSRAALFVFQLKKGEPMPVKIAGLDPARTYRLRELYPAPGRPALPQEGKTLTGEELMNAGVTPSCSGEFEACAIELAL